MAATTRWTALLCLAATLALARPAISQTTIIEAPGPEGPLAGAMTGPAGADVPVVVIIPGSGPTDRDGNNTYGIRAASYRLIAEGLAGRGIASVRIDKRGMFGSVRATAHGDAVTMDDYATDMHSWATTIRNLRGARCVWLLGHSEGGLTALAAARKPEGICGLLLASTPGRPLGDVMREQLRANPANAPLLSQAEGIIADLEAGTRVEAGAMHTALLPVFRPSVQGFLISVLALDPARLLADYKGPVLILQGLSDIQVGRVDAERLHQARPDTELVLLPKVSHALKAVASDDRAANLETYRNPDLPLAEGVVDALARFVKGR
jgi:pimeloyl-ACP methyl ester carboxylesterase